MNSFTLWTRTYNIDQVFNCPIKNSVKVCFNKELTTKEIIGLHTNKIIIDAKVVQLCAIVVCDIKNSSGN